MVIAEAPPAERWRLVRDPLSGWREDDPDAYPRCSVDAEHVIRNGDHYAISGIKLACLPCSRVAPPPAPVERPKTPAPAKSRVSGAADRQFGGAARLLPRKAAPAAPGARLQALLAPSTIAAPAPVLTAPVMVVEPTAPAPLALMPGSEPIGDWAPEPTAAPAPERLRIGRGLNHPDYGKPANRETRVCARDACGLTFVVRKNPDQRCCSRFCAGQVRRKPKETAEHRREAFRELRTCQRCPNTFVATSTSRNRRFCSNACALTATHERRRSAPTRHDARVTAIQPGVCETCGAEHPPAFNRPYHCSWACVFRAMAATRTHGLECFCLACSDRRQEAGLPPLVGVPL